MARLNLVAGSLVSLFLVLMVVVGSQGRTITRGQTFHLRILLHPQKGTAEQTCEVLEATPDQVHRALEHLHHVLVFRLV